MGRFAYTAVDSQGREQRGSIEARDARAAAAALRTQSLFIIGLADRGDDPTQITSASAAKKAMLLPRVVRTQDRIFFFRQLALMLRSGLTLLQALQVYREQALKPAMTMALERMAVAIQAEGKSLSQAMKAEGRLFPPLTIKLVETAEVSGELDVTLEQAANYLDRRASVRTSLMTSLTYPCIVVLTSVAVAIFLVVAVVPKFAGFFARRQIALPWSTQLLMDVSSVVTQYGLFLLAGAIVLVAAVLVAHASPGGRLVLDRMVLRVPLIGNLLSAAAMAQLARTLSMLLRSGVTLLEALRVSSGVTGNRAIGVSVEGAVDHILTGQTLASALRVRVIPSVVPHLVAVGERTGALGEVLEEIGNYYDHELQVQIRRMSTLIEPVMILIIGGMVGFVYFSFFQAVFQMATSGR